MKITKNFSPNYDRKKRLVNSIQIIVFHYTGMQSERESIKRLCNPNSKVSSHYLINRNGKVFSLVHDSHVAWHAGKSCWGKYQNLNKNSIGIELVNKGHQFGYTSFKKKQIASLIELCIRLIKKYKIDVILGMYHDQVLTPFKTLFKYDAINITLGLPYIRISPDHGVAENLVGKNIANPTSLIESIKFFNYIK